MFKDFSHCKHIQYEYEGITCNKICILYKNKPYMVKISNNNMSKDVDNGIVIREYLGSHIYGSLGIEVHKTILGTIDNQIVVACKHIQHYDETFIPFSTLRKNYCEKHGLPHINKYERDLKDTLKIISSHPLLVKAGDVLTHFWNMFVVDHLISNFDRNTSNWGILLGRDHVRLAPIFDNSGCFWNRNKQEVNVKINSSAHINKFKYDGKYVTAFELMHDKTISHLDISLQNIATKIDMNKIKSMIAEMYKHSLISNETGKFFIDTININRIEWLIPCSKC